MARYRLKVSEVEAERFMPELGQIPKGVQQEYLTGKYYVTTSLKQQVWVAPGNWVVRAPSGTGYIVYSDETFQNLYEEVPPEEALGDEQ